MPGGGGGELFGPGEFQLHRAVELQRGQRHDVLGEHLLLAAEAAAHPAGDHPDLLFRQAEDPAQGPPDQERDLAGGADQQPPVTAEGGDGGMGFERRVLHPLGPVRVLVDEVRRGEPGRHIAELGMQFRHDVPLRPADAGRGCVLVPVEGGGAGEHGVLRGEDGVQHLVVDLQRPHAGLRRRHRTGDDGGDALAAEPHDVVKHAGVVRVVGVELVLRGRKQLRRGVLVGEDGRDAGNRQRGCGVDGADPGVGMRGAQQFHVQQPGQFVGRDIQGVAGPSRDDGEAGGCGDVVAELAGRGGLRPGCAGLANARYPGSRGGVRMPFLATDGVPDGRVPRAPAQVALEVAGQVRPLLVIEGRGGHHHAGRAESALETLPVQELLLHRVKLGAGRCWPGPPPW